MDKAPGEDLASQHAALAKQIQVEENRRHPDETMLAKLKKEKLRVKDELLEQQSVH